MRRTIVMIALVLGCAACDRGSNANSVSSGSEDRILAACDYVTADDVARATGQSAERSPNTNSTAPCAFEVGSLESRSFVTVRVARGAGVKATFDGIAQRWPGSTKEVTAVAGVADAAVWIEKEHTLLALTGDARVDVQGGETLTRDAAVELAKSVVARL